MTEACCDCLSGERHQWMKPAVKRRLNGLVLLAMAEMRKLKMPESHSSKDKGDAFDALGSELVSLPFRPFEMPEPYNLVAANICWDIVTSLPYVEVAALAYHSEYLETTKKHAHSDNLKLFDVLHGRLGKLALRTYFSRRRTSDSPKRRP